ncbi:MAG: ParB/RepB/Spo0J family partition protein [Enhydrobacter sp.]|nr:MAG: ParB/RepB/Spo0J family partition protein [Enhydrobacter sp.]
MSQPPRPRGLGRGLSALLGDEDVAAAVAPVPAPPRAEAAPPSRPASRAPMSLPITHLRAGRYQPRTTFDNLDSLVDSVRQHGLLQPILVRPLPGEASAYEIVAGERRWRAAQKAQLHEVPVVLRSLDDFEALQLALVENLQRADLTAIDEAKGYHRLHTEFGQTQEEIAARVGKSRPHVANVMRLLDLPPGVQDMIQRGDLTFGHGRALLAFPDPAATAERAIKDKLSVRDLERLAAEEKKPSVAKGPRKAPAGAKTADTRALEKRIEEALGLKASLSLKGAGEQSLLTLEIRDFDQLDTVVERLTRR